MGCCASVQAGGVAVGAGAARAPTTVDDGQFHKIVDNYDSLEQVQDALRKAGLESSNIILAVDYTKSNEWAGRNSFGGLNLHNLGGVPNPYEQAISAIGRTLAAFDDDDLIPTYGFGDAATKDSHVFSFLPGDKPCEGLDQVLARYREITPSVKLAGPTSFAPAINHACRVVAASGGQYHILVLIADGQVTRSSDMPPGQHSPQEAATVRAIEAASKLPLSIIMVGVGDGPWELMEEFDDQLPARAFDNFQFVNFTEVASRYPPGPRRDAAFALRALMEIPDQFKSIQRLGLLGTSFRPPMSAVPLPPPVVPQRGSPSHSGAASQRVSDATGAGAGAACSHPSHGAGGGGTASSSTRASRDGAGAGTAGQKSNRASASGKVSFASAASDRSCSSSDAGGASTSVAGGGDGKPDPMYICPITQEVMTDPVMAADGFTYDRSAISQWLTSHRTSPMTNERLKYLDLTPNHALRSAIKEWQERQKRASQSNAPMPAGGLI